MRLNRKLQSPSFCAIILLTKRIVKMRKDRCRAMITLIGIPCKEYSEIIGADKEHRNDEVIQSWLELAQCPNEKCRAIGQFNNHGYYTRGYEDLGTGEDHDGVLTVLRGKCKSCGTTHAFLPADVIPYKWPLIICFLTTMKEEFHSSGEDREDEAAMDTQETQRTQDTQDTQDIQDTQDSLETQSKSALDDNEYHYKGPFTLRMAYRNLELLMYYLKYLQHTIRDLLLWEKAQQPGLWEVVEIILSSDIHLIQQRTLELHHKPLFFRRKRTITKIPYTGMLKTG